MVSLKVTPSSTYHKFSQYAECNLRGYPSYIGQSLAEIHKKTTRSASQTSKASKASRLRWKKAVNRHYSIFVSRWLSILSLTWCLYGYGSIPIDTFLVGWTSIYQLFWGSLGTRVLTHPHIINWPPYFFTLLIQVGDLNWDQKSDEKNEATTVCSLCRPYDRPHQDGPTPNCLD